MSSWRKSEINANRKSMDSEAVWCSWDRLNFASATTPQQLRISNYASATTTQQPRLSNHGSATKLGSRFSNYASATKTNSRFSNHASATKIYSRFSNQTSATKLTPSGKHIQSHIWRVRWDCACTCQRGWILIWRVRWDCACTCQRGWDFDLTCKMRLCMYLPEGVGFWYEP